MRGPLRIGFVSFLLSHKIFRLSLTFTGVVSIVSGFAEANSTKLSAAEYSLQILSLADMSTEELTVLVLAGVDVARHFLFDVLSVGAFRFFACLTWGSALMGLGFSFVGLPSAKCCKMKWNLGKTALLWLFNYNHVYVFCVSCSSEWWQV